MHHSYLVYIMKCSHLKKMLNISITLNHVMLVIFHITLFISITKFYEIDNIQSKCGEYLRILRGILSVPQNIVINMYNVMHESISTNHMFFSCFHLIIMMKCYIYFTSK